uniref:Uncharacterized protein n=1 Tax=Anguilla anguilla TaxID=7936 RepID=A0A0E9VUS2_ANGAN
MERGEYPPFKNGNGDRCLFLVLQGAVLQFQV